MKTTLQGVKITPKTNEQAAQLCEALHLPKMTLDELLAKYNITEKMTVPEYDKSLADAGDRANESEGIFTDEDSGAWMLI